MLLQNKSNLEFCVCTEIIGPDLSLYSSDENMNQCHSIYYSMMGALKMVQNEMVSVCGVAVPDVTLLTSLEGSSLQYECNPKCFR